MQKLTKHKTNDFPAKKNEKNFFMHGQYRESLTQYVYKPQLKLESCTKMWKTLK